MKKLAIVFSFLLLTGFLPACAQDAQKPLDMSKFADSAWPTDDSMSDESVPEPDMSADLSGEMNFDSGDEMNADIPEEMAPDVTSDKAEMKDDAKAETKTKAEVKSPKGPISFGDYRSTTLATKAWNALANKDIESVLAYTNKCIELYAEKAREMQAGLTEYVTGKNEDVFKLWALNDVATSYYIQGLAYLNAGMKDEAKEAFNKVIRDYSYGQTWDPKGWFWKPADAAKEKLAAIESGVDTDFGDYSSSELTTKAWVALEKKDLETVKTLTQKVFDLYSVKAKEMQSSLKEYPWESKEKTFSYWALNDVGTSLFILGEAYRNAGKRDEAKEAYKKLIDEYFYAQCWDPNGWFWKPAEAAQQKLGELDNV